jgi:hypothetical protein
MFGLSALCLRRVSAQATAPYVSRLFAASSSMSTTARAPTESTQAPTLRSGLSSSSPLLTSGAKQSHTPHAAHTGVHSLASAQSRSFSFGSALPPFSSHRLRALKARADKHPSDSAAQLPFLKVRKPVHEHALDVEKQRERERDAVFFS